MMLEPALHAPATPQLPAMAVFADIENVCGAFEQLGLVPDLAPVMARLALEWRPLVRRSFGDIASLPPFFSKHQVRRILQKTYFAHEDVPHSAGQKNSADIRLIVSAMALAYQRPDISHFAILSADRDFLPLVLHLRELGRTVIGVGPSPGLVHEEYRGACDFFLYHENIFADAIAQAAAAGAGVAPRAPVGAGEEGAAAPDAGSVLSCLLAAIRHLQSQYKDPTSTTIAVQLKEMYPTLNVKEMYGSFKAMCLSFAASGDLILRNLDQANFTVLPALRPAARADAALVGADPDAPVVEVALAEQYRQWIRAKMTIDMPTEEERRVLYQALVDVLAQNEGGITLSGLAQEVGARLPGQHNSAFRVYYSLFRSRVLSGTTTAQAFNPCINGLLVRPDQLDSYFVANTVKLCLKGGHLPFDAKAWSSVLFGDEARAPEMEAVAAEYEGAP